jgi:hypothetical protein
MNDNKTTPEKQTLLDKLAMFRTQMTQIESRYSTKEAFDQLQKENRDAGHITGPTTTSKPRGTPRENKETGERRISERVEHYHRFVTMLGKVPRFKKNIDCNLVKFFLYKHLRFAGYDYVINEFKYQNSIIDTFAIANGRGVEFEIKLSREDYLTDFSKIYWVGKNVNKHSVLAAGESALITKFYFVVPENMIDIRECPKHCGLIWATETKANALSPGANGKVISFRVVKNPPLLHTRFVAPLTWKTIADRLYVRNENLVARYEHSIFQQTFKSVTDGANNTLRNDSATGAEKPKDHGSVQNDLQAGSAPANPRKKHKG